MEVNVLRASAQGGLYLQLGYEKDCNPSTPARGSIADRVFNLLQDFSETCALILSKVLYRHMTMSIPTPALN